MGSMTNDHLSACEITANDVFGIVRMAEMDTVYAVLDAADAPTVPGMMIAAGDEAKALYMSNSDPELELAAPYLVKLDPVRLAEIHRNLWNDAWGIIIEFDGDLMTLRRHLRQFLIVDSPEGQPLYFRFYDPRVLHPFIQSSDDAARAEFFGPVRAYIARGSDPDTFVRYELVPAPKKMKRPTAFGL
jgi:Domain of unknown function (DUF4123)